MIRYIVVIVTILTIIFGCESGGNSVDRGSESTIDYTKYVDPNIGAVHARWFFYSPAAVPFGMAKLAPHTNAYESKGSWLPGGYDNRHLSIEGFGHFHEFQIGGLVVMPTTGDIKIKPGTLEDPDSGYRSRIDKKEEHSEAGYYSVTLQDYNIKTEITATQRVGYHRYTFPKSDSSHILFDIGHRQGESSDVTEAYAKVVNGNEIEGYIETYPEYNKFCDEGNLVKFYFIAKLSKRPQYIESFTDTTINSNVTSTKGINNGLILSFQTEESEVIEMQVGLSYTSIDNARVNLERECDGVDFNSAREASHNQWSEMLGRIDIQSDIEDDKLKFYTALYHALLGRGTASDINGKYITHNKKIAQIPLDSDGNPKYTHYNSDGMWGAFWNLTQVWALAYPKYFRDYVQTNIDFQRETGWLHDGVAAGTYTNGVQTNFQGLIIASAYNAGIRDFDIEEGYRAALKNETEYRNRDFGSGKYDLSYFIKDGFIPYQDTIISNGWVFNFGASHTLEFCFSSYAVSEMAEQLGRDEDAKLLKRQAQYYRNLFDNRTKFITPKYRDGTFITDFDPMTAWAGFQEGNGYQYTWYVPHDIIGLKGLIGEELFNKRLNTMFRESHKTLFGGGKEVDSFSGVEKLYNHGNQPCLHNSWLFNYSGQPWNSQKWTRTICNEFYGTTDTHGYGYGQDEDEGQLGAWYVMASMGIFDVKGHASKDPRYMIGSPTFDKITIKLDPDYFNGEEVTIVTENNSPDNIYIESATLNGEEHSNCWVDRQSLIDGGVLKLKMSSTPNKSWGVFKE